MGMLAYFVNIYLSTNVMTPTYNLLLFIVSVLALAWSIATLFSYHRSSSNAQFVALIDLAFVGALIAGVYYLRFIATADCAHLVVGSRVDVDFGILGSATVWGVEFGINKTCSMLKACFAMGIMNCVFFAVTAVLAWVHGGNQARSEKRVVVERRRGSSHHSRHHSRSRSGGHRSRSGERSRRSSHSHNRAYL
jgi:hypothetical protein